MYSSTKSRCGLWEGGGRTLVGFVKVQNKSLKLISLTDELPLFLSPFASKSSDKVHGLLSLMIY